MLFSAIERTMIAGFVGHAKNEEDWLALNDLHRRFWSGQGGAIFNHSPEVEDRLNTWFLEKHGRLLECLQQELVTSEHQCPVICEIGSGNGLALNYLSQQFPTVPRFVGIDINEYSTQRNKERWGDNPKLEFVASDALDWVRQNAAGGWIFFSNSGVMEYFPQKNVEALYHHTASLDKPSWWVLTEPRDLDHDFTTETRSRVHGSELSYSHNHPYLLRQAGWKVVEQFESEVGAYRCVSICAKLG